MSTRGAIGFVLNGDERITYNHSDSYPSYLGANVLKFAAEVEDWDAVRDRVARLTVVDENTEPTPEQAAALAEYTSGAVSSGSDWYATLRNTQGNLDAILSAGFVTDGSAFPLDGLFCEYAYIIDLDANRLEAYVGFQKTDHTDGRFAGRATTETFVPAYEGETFWSPVRLAASWPLDALPTSEEFETTVRGVESFYRPAKDRPEPGTDYYIEPIPGPVVK